jgi:hypothetical protein
MHRLTIILILGMVALVIGGSLIFLYPRHKHRNKTRYLAQSAEDDTPASRDERESAATGSVAALWGEVVSLRHDIEALKAELSRRPKAETTDREEESPSSSQTGSEQQPGGGGEKKAEEGEKLRAMVARAEEEFANEPYNASWSSAINASIQGLANKNEGIRSALRSAECRSRTCRVELLDNVAANLGKNLPAFLSEFAAALPNVTADRITGADGTSSYVLYLSGGT